MTPLPGRGEGVGGERTVSAHDGTREERDCARRWRDVDASESLVGRRRSLARESAPKRERDGEGRVTRWAIERGGDKRQRAKENRLNRSGGLKDTEFELISGISVADAEDRALALEIRPEA